VPTVTDLSDVVPLSNRIESTRPRAFLSRLFITIIASTALFAAADPASAIPAFARREGQPCSLCHSNFPKLNTTGMEYKSNGFRFPGEPVQNVWDLKGGPPVAVIAQVKAFIDHSEIAGQNDDTDDGPDMEIENISVVGAGNFSGRVSGFAELEFDGGGNAEAGPTWGQVNDLIGPQGEGNLNLRLGKTVADLPFLSQDRRVIQNTFLANDMMGFLDDQTGAELNGNIDQSIASNESLIHRYGAGIARTDRGSANKFRQGYAYYSLELPKDLILGTIVQGGEDQDDDPTSPDDFTGGDLRQIGFLIAGEDTFDSKCGQFTFDFDYAFQATKYRELANNRNIQHYHNLMLEMLYTPVESWTFGTRVDWLIETEQARQNNDGWRLSELARWNVIQNAWLGAEYRHEQGGKDSPVTGNAKTVESGRVYFSLAF
jgi:hypothetical protein